MGIEQSTIESGEKPKVKAEQKTVIEAEKSPEEIEKEMLADSEKETANFEREEKSDLESVEKKASADGLQIDDGDKNELEGLSQEAKQAKDELRKEISGGGQLEKKDIDQERTQELLKLGKEKIHEMYSKGESLTPEYQDLHSMLIEQKNNTWKSKDEVDVANLEEKLEKMRKKDAFEKGKEKILSLHGQGNNKSSEYFDLYSHLTEGFGEKLKWADINNIDADRVEEMIRAIEKPVENKIENKNTSKMKERTIKTPEMLDREKASRKFLAEERAKLIEEIRAERKKQKEKLLTLKDEIEKANITPENGSKGDEQYGKLAEMQSDEANAMAERFSSGEELIDEEGVDDEQLNLEQLIANSEGLGEIRKKVEEHYAKADEVAKEKFESMQKTVEQTMIRNNAFIVHTFLLDERLRHNANSNISQRATAEDDINILLSLEPSISTSSVMPGSKQGLWGNGMGVILGGGDIRGVRQGDDSTVTKGIKNRDGTISNSEEIDQNVSDKKDRSYNELVVNNPKVFGFFQNVSVDKLGKMHGFSHFKEAFGASAEGKRKKDEFMRFMGIAEEKGMPPLILTPNNKLFEFLSIDDEGIVSVGAEIAPEQVAKGKAGLPNEKRKELGDDVISKNLFRRITDQKEAKGIMAGLTGQEGAEMELSREEYLNYIKDETNIPLQDFPINLISDKEFMIEAAKYYHNPNTIYEYAGDNLRRDVDFIRHMYEVVKGKIYSSIPKDIRNNEEIVSLAIENDDIRNNLDVSLAESPIIWEKIINSLVEKKDSEDWDYLRDVGESKVLNTDFAQFLMKKENEYSSSEVNMTKKVLTDGGFIQKLNKKYPKFKFEINDSDRVRVTRIAE